MRPKPQDSHTARAALNRWLAAERADGDDVADAALREMFEALPLLAPAAGFADRVFARVGLQPVKRDVFASFGVRLMLVASLIALGLGAIWLPPVLQGLGRFLGESFSLSGVMGFGVRAVAEASRGLALVLSVGEWLFAFGRALSELLRAPRAMAALAACLLVSALAFRFLRDHISGERSYRYVDPI